jgi:hypothetical protein
MKKRLSNMNDWTSNIFQCIIKCLEERVLFKFYIPVVLILAAVGLTIYFAWSFTEEKLIWILTVWFGIAGVGALNWVVIQALAVARPYVMITKIIANKSKGQSGLRVSVYIKNFGSIDARKIKVECVKQKKSMELLSLFPEEEKEIEDFNLITEGDDIQINLTYYGRLRKYEKEMKARLKEQECEEVEYLPFED